MMTSEYAGNTAVRCIERISAKDISPEDFFDKYISTRTPVIFTDELPDDEWKASSWTNDYLEQKCGSCQVKVEVKKTDQAPRFGLGNEKSTKFSTFLQSIKKGEGDLYLTTQDLVYTSEGQPSILSPPLSLLVNDFPINPSLVPNLVLSNANIWFGSSSQFTSSGLHHDFHDNLYILLRGKKKFTIYNPTEAPNLYPVGEIVKIHKNGRINYKDQPTRPGIP